MTGPSATESGARAAGPAVASTPDVLRVGDGHREALTRLLAAYGLELVPVPAGAPIPGSYWGEPEAGLQRDRVYVRDDTPVHSALHEAAHAICMGPARRAALATDAGGDHREENAVCCLQVVLADRLPGVGRARLLADMDAWGYTFRLGSARAWFDEEAGEARDWLRTRGLWPAGA